jgi:peptidoglycan-associated lipoprotein
MLKRCLMVCVVGLLLVGCRTRVRDGWVSAPPPLQPVIHSPVIPSEDRSEPRQDLNAKAPVISDAPTVQVAAKERKTVAELLEGDVKDAFFSYNRHDLLPEARRALDQDVSALKSIFEDFPGIVLEVEGHCDERGSAEYNLALGDLRARTARDFLVGLGVTESGLAVISYGKERPQCT